MSRRAGDSSLRRELAERGLANAQTFSWQKCSRETSRNSRRGGALTGADYQGRRVLVTGGAGFIGSHLVDDLIQRGAEVTALDDLSSGYLKNLESAEGRMAFVKMDLAKDDLRPLLAKQQFAYVFHVAGHASVPASVERPRLDFECNALATVTCSKPCVTQASLRHPAHLVGGHLRRRRRYACSGRTPRKHRSLRTPSASWLRSITWRSMPGCTGFAPRSAAVPRLWAAPPEAGDLRFPL